MTRSVLESWSFADPRAYLEHTVHGTEDLPPLVVTVAITGGVQGKVANMVLPETPEEQAQSTSEAWNAGASVVHVYARRRDDPAMVSHATERYLEEGSLFSTLGIGAYQLPQSVLAIAHGGHVRVGPENSVYVGKGHKAESNAHLVERIVRVAGLLGREVASPAQARSLLGISAAPSSYPEVVKSGLSEAAG